MSDANFLIYSLARCGSTHLVRILNRLAGSELIAEEPFHPVNAARRFGNSPQTAAELKQALDSLARQRRGIKHVWHPKGWPFGAQAAGLNQALLKATGWRVLLLVRHNILQRRVSDQISEQLQLWHPRNAEERKRFADFDYQPLDEADLIWWLQNEPSLVEECRQDLRASGKPWIEVAYEELYAGDSAVRAATFAKVFAFAGLAFPGQAALDSLLARHAKVNSEASYQRIPNSEAINYHLGSDATGWLFDAR